MTRPPRTTLARAARRMCREAIVGGSLLFLACEPAASQVVPTAEQAYRRGDYEDAANLLERIAMSDSASSRVRRTYVRALGMVGRYADAEAAARRFAVPGPIGKELANTLGEILVLRGSIAEAEGAFSRAMTEKASDSLTARLNLAILRFDRGERDAAMAQFDSFIDVYNDRRAQLTARELMAVGIACRYLGLTQPQLFKDALRALDEASAADSMDLEPRVRVAQLFLEKYNSGDAQGDLAAILQVNPKHPAALLAAARLRHFDGAPGADSLVRRSLAVNPSFVPARIFRAGLLLDTEDHDAALAEIRQALQVDSTSLEALAMLAAISKLRHDERGFEDAKRRALARNPRYADLFNTAAELSARNRLYSQAVDFAREAIALDSTSSRAQGLLGMNQLRVGAIDSGRASLERSFKADPYDVWVKNTLDLLDTFGEYETIPTSRFRLFIVRREADVMGIYLGELLEQAYDRFATTYNYRPPTPIRAEVYRNHADFSVRTVGLAGLGALGVSFGNVLAIDSPASREAGQFNWGSTVWHELAHTFTLGMTNHRVPRWLSEGISVYEERRARPGWGADVTPSFLASWKAKRLVPVSRMNDGFMRPTYGEQVVHSYYQASLVCELIERDFGPRALGEMLVAYRDGLDTEQVFQRVLRTTPEAFDERFEQYMESRFARSAASIKMPAPGDRVDSALARIGGRGRGGGAGGTAGGEPDDDDFIAQLVHGRELLDRGEVDGAVPFFERAKALFPEYSGNDSPRWYLARIHKEKGAFAKAADELKALTAANENHYQAHLDLADVLQALGDEAGAAEMLDRSMYIYPYDAAMHTRLAGLYSKLGNRQRAVRERKAVVALAPVDRAEALYQLALAHHEAGDATNARREVLRALEEAPNFERAQTLLLTLRRGSPPPGTTPPAVSPTRPPPATPGGRSP